MGTVFQVNDKVFDINYGWGLVVNILNHSNYPVVVNFKEDDNTYTYDGKSSTFNDFASLSFTEYDFVNGGFSQDRGTFSFNGCNYKIPSSYKVVQSGLKRPELPKQQFLIKCGVIVNEGIEYNKRTEKYFLITAPTFSDACEKIEKEYNLDITSFDNCTL